MDDLSTNRQRTVREVVHDVVADMAPEELPILAGLDRLDEDEALRRLTRRRRPREPLGFGMDTIATLVTAIAWVAVQESVKRIIGPVAEGLPTRVRAGLRRLFGRKPPDTVVPPLTPEQLIQVHQRVLELAEQNGLKADKAAELAKRVKEQLEPGTTDREQSGERP